MHIDNVVPISYYVSSSVHLLSILYLSSVFLRKGFYTYYVHLLILTSAEFIFPLCINCATFSYLYY